MAKTSRPRVRLMLGGDIAIGPGKADLLEAVAETGSISAAARAMDMSYKRAWYLLDTMNRCFVEPVVTASKGDRSHGGASLTPLGVKVLKRYRAIEAKAAAEVQATSVPSANGSWTNPELTPEIGVAGWPQNREMTVSDCPWCSPGAAADSLLCKNRSHFVVKKPHPTNPAALVIPWSRREPFNFTSSEWEDIAEALQATKQHLRQFAPEGFTIGWNSGAAAGQHVFTPTFMSFADTAKTPRPDGA